MDRRFALAAAFLLVGYTGDDNGPGEGPSDSGLAFDSTQPNVGHDASITDGARDATSDTNVADTNVADTSADDVADASIADTNVPDTFDAGPLGSSTNPALSCKAILLAGAADAGPDGGYASGTFFVSPTGKAADAFATYCEMELEGGGWTKVTSAVPEAQVRALLGASGRQMVKCTDTGAAYFASPSFVPLAPAMVDGGADAGLDAGVDAGDAGIAVVWSWDVHDFVQVPGTWRANGADQACSNNPEYSQFTNCAWWGVGCGDGPGGNNKFFPGVFDAPSAGFCTNSTTAGHTNGALSICGSNNYGTYSVLVRAD